MVGGSDKERHGHLRLLFFNRDVTGCAYIGSLGGSSGGSPPAGDVGAANLLDAANGVYVRTYTGAGASRTRRSTWRCCAELLAVVRV